MKQNAYSKRNWSNDLCIRGNIATVRPYIHNNYISAANSNGKLPEKSSATTASAYVDVTSIAEHKNILVTGSPMTNMNQDNGETVNISYNIDNECTKSLQPPRQPQNEKLLLQPEPANEIGHLDYYEYQTAKRPQTPIPPQPAAAVPVNFTETLLNPAAEIELSKASVLTGESRNKFEFLLLPTTVYNNDNSSKGAMDPALSSVITNQNQCLLGTNGLLSESNKNVSLHLKRKSGYSNRQVSSSNRFEPYNTNFEIQNSNFELQNLKLFGANRSVNFGDALAATVYQQLVVIGNLDKQLEMEKSKLALLLSQLKRENDSLLNKNNALHRI